MDSIERLWDRIETWLKANAPDIAHALTGGVTEEDLRLAEETMGLVLPEDVKASYRRQNGFYAGTFLMQQAIFYDLAGMVRGQQGSKAFWADLLSNAPRSPKYLSGPIQPVWWHPSWLPLTGDGAGNLWCLDLAPSPEGKIGQIIDFDHEVGPTKVIATSFQELLSTFAAQLEAGHYVVAGLNLCDPENVLDDPDDDEDIEEDD
jgi:cell wall assembly regulator SMI1